MALSPVLLPPPPPPAGGDADKYYYPYYYNTEDNADKYYNPYYFTTKEEADKFYKPDPWEAYYYQLPSLSPGEKIQGPREELPQHTGLYDGPINIEENIIPDTGRMFLKNFHWIWNFQTYVADCLLVCWRNHSSASVTSSKPMIMLCFKSADQNNLAFTSVSVYVDWVGEK